MSRSLANLNVVIGAKLTGFEKGLSKMDRKLTRFQRKMKRLGTDLTQSLTLPILGAGAAAVTTAAKYEKLRIRMNALTGSAELGGKAFDRLVQFSANTPFQLDEIVKVNNALLGFGLNADQAYTSTRRLADISALTGGNMDNLAVAFGQAAAEGRVMTRDVRQFINQGVPILDILADSMGVARNEIMGMAEDGKLSFEILNEAMIKATSAGGRFEGGTAKLADTLSGVFSTLKDNVSIALGKVGDSIVQTTGLKDRMKSLSEWVGRAADTFSRLSPQVQKNIIKTALFTAAIGPTLIVLGKLPAVIGAVNAGLKVMLSTLTFLLSPTGLFVIGITAIAAGVLYLRENIVATLQTMRPLVNVLAAVSGPMQLMAMSAKAALDTFDGGAAKFQTFGEFVDSVTGKVKGLAASLLSLSEVPVLGSGVGASEADFENLYGAGLGGGGGKGSVAVPLLETLDMIPGKIQSMTESVGLALPQMAGTFGNFATVVATNFDAIARGVHSMFEGIWDSIAAGENAFKGVISSIGKLIKKLVVAAVAAFALNSLLGAVGLGGLAESVGNFKGIFGKLIALKKGGVTTGPTVAMIGDNASGRELVHPWERNKDFAADIARYMGGGGPAVPSVIKLVAEGGDLVSVLDWSKGAVRDSRGY